MIYVYMSKEKKATTYRVSEKSYNLFRQKVLADKLAYYKITKKKVRLTSTRVINAFLYLYIHNKIKVNPDIREIVNNNFVRGIEIDKKVLVELKKRLIEEEMESEVPYPRGVGGVIGRLMQSYLRMDFREVISKVLEWEKQTGEDKK